MHPGLDRTAIIFGDREQLDHVTKSPCISDIGLRDVRDSFGMNLNRLQRRAECERYEEAKLMRRVMAPYVESRIGLRKAGGLRLGERRFEFGALIGHRAQD